MSRTTKKPTISQKTLEAESMEAIEHELPHVMPNTVSQGVHTIDVQVRRWRQRNKKYQRAKRQRKIDERRTHTTELDREDQS